MSYEFDGDKYKQASKHQKEWGTEIISKMSQDEVTEPLPEDGYILDLGCGDGILTKDLTQLVPKGKVLGIDASIGMIQTAKALETDQLHFEHKDINEMQNEGTFDLIFSNAALHWVRDHNTLLEKCYKALKKNGRLKFNFAGEGNCATFFEVVRQVMTQECYKQYFLAYEWPWYNPNVSEYEALIQKLHLFGEVKVREENKDRYFKNKDEMIGWIDQPCLVPFLKMLPDYLKQTFREKVISEMVAATTQPDGTCFETFRRINLSAKK